MKLASFWLSAIVLLLPSLALSQSTSETALTFSRFRPGGSARIQGLGGAQTSLGGDYSSAFSNPAGLGMFNRSEVTISPAFQSVAYNSSYLNSNHKETKTNLNIPGFSVVFQNSKDGNNGFLSGAFAISFNRINNFNQNFNYNGLNDKNSIIDYFIEDATGFLPNSFLAGNENFNTPTGLAYNNYLIEDSTFFDPNASNRAYLSVMGTYPNNPKDIREALQEEDVKTTGTQNQWSFSYGANIQDKVFIGAGIGFSAIRYTSNKTYTESDFRFVLDNTFDPLDKLQLDEELRITGSGINATLGVIARPIDMVQIGVSYATPTYYKLTDSYKATLSTNWNNFDYFGNSRPINKVTESSDEVLTEYDLKTPGRLNLGATVFLQKKGFLSADVEFVSYENAKYTSNISGISFDSDNERIKTLYKSSVNYRVGGEYRLNQYRIRTGFSYMPDPFESQQNGVGREIMSVSGGFGYRTEIFYLDFALVLTQGKTTYRPYRVNSEYSPLVELKNQTTVGIITLGFPF